MNTLAFISLSFYTIHESYEIAYNRLKNKQFSKSIKTSIFSSSQRIDEQLVLKDFEIGTENPFLNITSNVIQNSNGFSINDSYLIFCGERNENGFEMNGCEPTEEDMRISCKCQSRTSGQTVVYILIGFWCLTIIIATKPIMELVLETEKKEKLTFHSLINCNERNFKHKYIILLRLAKGSLNYDLRDVTIDIEFFNKSKESIGKN